MTRDAIWGGMLQLGESKLLLLSSIAVLLEVLLLLLEVVVVIGIVVFKIEKDLILLDADMHDDNDDNDNDDDGDDDLATFWTSNLRESN